MSTSPTNAFPPDDLVALLQQCQAALQQYRRTHETEIDVHGCTMIVQRATQGELAAIIILLEEVSPPLIVAYCRDEFAHPDVRAEVVQRARFRLWRRFQRPPPLHFESFVEYRGYLRITVLRIKQEISNEAPIGEESLEEIEERGQVLPQPTSTAQVEARQLLEEILQVLSSLERVVIILRYIYQLNNKEISQALQTAYPELTEEKVQAIVSGAMRKLRRQGRTS